VSWDAIGAIGEIVGALAVVVSLVYLGSQIRLAAKTTQLQIEQSETASLIAQQQALIDNPDLGREITPGSINIRDDLHMKKAAFWYSWHSNASFNFKHANSPELLDELERKYGQYIRYWYRNNDDFRPWWQSASRNFPRDFVKWVDQHGNDAV